VAITVGDLLAFLRLDDDPFRRTLRQAPQQMRRAGEDIGAEANRAGEKAGSEFNRGFRRNSAGRLIDKDTGKYVREALLGSVTTGMQEAGKTAGDAMRNAMTAGVNLSTNIWNWIPAILALVAALAALGPAFYVFGGLLGSLPALAAGGGLAMGVLAMGLHGITDAFKKTSAGGSNAVDVVHQVEMAQRSLARAQRDVRKAQEAVNKAIADEIKRRRDLNLELRQAKEGQLQAAAAVARAKEALARARGTGDMNLIGEAEADYREALLNLESVKNRVADLGEEQTKTAAQTVEGSDQVVAALERQQSAMDALADAQYNLARAGKSSGGGGVADMVKLAPAAQDFVNKIKSLGKAFTELRLAVQERLFRGLGDAVVGLFNAWKPTLTDQMTKMADVFNGIFKTFTKTTSKPKFIEDVTKGLDAFRGMIKQIGEAIAGPLTEAFGTLAGAAGPVMQRIGTEVWEAINIFAAWIEKLDKSGELDEFFKEAGEQVGFFIDAVTSLIRIIGSLFAIIAGTQPKSKDGGVPSPLETLAHTLEKYADWLADPKNQETINEWIDKIKDWGTWLINEGIPRTMRLIDTLQDWSDRIDGWITDFENWTAAIEDWYDTAQNRFDRFKQYMTAPLRTVWSPLWEGFRTYMNMIIGAWNRLEFTIPSFSFFGTTVGGTKITTPDITGLAAGGVVKARTGGMLAQIGEGGRDEMVAPLETAYAMIARAVGDAMAGANRGDGGDVVIMIDREVIQRESLRALRRNKPAVAAAAKAGTRARTFAGGTAAALA
jgi:hypothetical protein